MRSIAIPLWISLLSLRWGHWQRPCIQAALIGKLINRYGEENLIKWTFLISALTLILLLLSGNFIYVLVLTVVFFTLTAVMRPAINTLLSQSAGEEQGFVAGMNNAYMSLGNILGPAVAGTIFDLNINAPYLFGAIILVFSLYFSMSRLRRMKQAVVAN